MNDQTKENEIQKRVELNRRHREWRKKNHDHRLGKERARHKKLQDTNDTYRKKKVENMKRWKEKNALKYAEYQRQYYLKRRQQKHDNT